jgi:Flp pilus assembly protein TadG
MKFQEYCRTTSGNVGVMVALAALVLLGGAGAAVDYSHKLTWQTSLQAAVDGAALAAAGASENDREKTASLYFDANFKHDENVSLLKLKTSEDADAVVVTADISVQTSVMSALGFKTMKATAKGAASISDRSLEVALVLDVSGSMNASLGGNSRISVLKQAAQDLVDTITDGGKNMSKVEVGIVPFNMNVNVGKTNTSFVKDTTDPLFTGQPWEGCVLERAGTGATSDSFDNSSGVNGKWQAYIWPPEPDSAGNCTVPSNGGNTGYASLDAANGYQVMLQGPNFNCVRHESNHKCRNAQPLQNS